MKHWWLIMVLFTLLFAGCTELETPMDDLPTPVNELPTDTVELLPETTDPGQTPTSAASAESSDLDKVGAELLTKVEDDLALDRGSLITLSVEEKTWPDASLGCPKPGMVYAQVLTEGWLVVYAGPDGEEIPVHADRGLKHYTICSERDQPEAKQELGDLHILSVINAATQLLADELDIPAEKVAVSEITPKSWRNSCLGCAEPEENCLTVITPGFQVELMADGQNYTVHTDSDGSARRLCEKTDSSAPGGE